LRLFRGLLLTILLLPLTALAGSTPRAGEPPLPLDQYEQRLRETRALLADLPTLPPQIAERRLQSDAARWEAVSAVTLPDGETVPLDTSFLVAQLRRRPPDAEQLTGLLDTLLAALDTSSPQPDSVQSGAVDTGALAPILARPEYQWPEPPQPPDWWLRLQEWWSDLLDKLFGGSGGRVSVPVGYIVTGLAALALIAALAYALRGLFSGLVAETEMDGTSADDENMSPTAAFKRAQELAAGGDRRTAVRYLYLSSLLLLEERGLLRYDRSRTNREYLRSVAHLPGLAGGLRDVVEIFERVWYGYQPLDADAYDRYAAQVTELRHYTE